MSHTRDACDELIPKLRWTDPQPACFNITAELPESVSNQQTPLVRASTKHTDLKSTGGRREVAFFLLEN